MRQGSIVLSGGGNTTSGACVSVFQGAPWLEEMVDFTASGGEGLIMAKKIYRDSFLRYEELTAPYPAVIDIDKNPLPKPEEVDSCPTYSTLLLSLLLLRRIQSPSSKVFLIERRLLEVRLY